MLIISPPLINELVPMFSGAGLKSAQLSTHYEPIAKQYDAFFFDSSKVVAGGTEDGVHLGIEANRSLGLAIASVIADILK